MNRIIIFILFLAATGYAQTTRTVCPSGCTHTTINAAITAAARGDTIVLTAGATYTENVILRYKATGTGYITIESSAMNDLPAAGTRVTPDDAANMPLIRSSSGGSDWTIRTELTGGNPASHYILRGLRIAKHASSFQYEIIALGYSAYEQEEESEIPHDFIIDRCYIHGEDGSQVRRGIAVHADNVQIINSSILNIWENGADSQAIWLSNGGRDVLIGNNAVEAGAENIFTGGSGTPITGMVPERVVIEHNYVFKRLTWRGASPNRQVKNLLELKSGDDITIRNNIFENVWTEAQTGNAIVLTPRGESSSHRLQNVTFEWNIIRNCGEGIRIGTEDNYDSTPPFHNLNINNNLLVIEGDEYDGQGFAFLIGKGGSQTINGLTITHNTSVKLDGYGAWLVIAQSSGAFANSPVFRANIDAGAVGVDYVGQILSDLGTGSTALAAMSTSGSYTYTENVMQIGSSSGYPSGNYFPSSASAIGFEDFNGGNYALNSGSSYKGVATGGADPGVNWAELQTRTQYVIAGTNYNGEEPPVEPQETNIFLRGVRLRGIRLN